MKSLSSTVLGSLLLMSLGIIDINAQDYVSPLQPAETGQSQGVKTKLVSSEVGVKTYVLIFTPGDEVRSGLTEFANQYNVKSANYSAIGDATSLKVGFFDYDKKMFKVIPIDEPAEVVSLIGDIAIFDGKPVAHTHVAVATKDGSLKGGHLLELRVGPTLEVFVTVYSTALNKKLDSRYGAAVIDLGLEK